MSIFEKFSGFNLRRVVILFGITILISFSFSIVTIAQDDEFDQNELSQTSPSQEDPVMLFNKGQEAHSKGNLEEALKLYDLALKAKADFPEAEYQRGIVLMTLDDPQRSETAFRNAAGLKPDWPLPRFQLGLLYLRSARYSEAEDLLEEAIQLDTTNYPAYSALSEVLIKSGAPASKLENLLVRLQTGVDLANAPVGIWISKASIERRLGNYESARLSALKALEISKNDPAALSELIEAYLAKAENKKALEAAHDLMLIDPRSRPGKMLLARAYYLNDNANEAINVLRSIEKPDKDVSALLEIIRSNGNVSVES
ncbi:MAG: hypothetical protein KDB79_03635, partial [Acidobacteria bacterium]|nr:hypothetical protein [Acidobacteriota bacterium]